MDHPANERAGCWGDKLLLVSGIMLVGRRKTAELPAWAPRFNVPFFNFPAFSAPSQCKFNGRINIKVNTTHVKQSRLNRDWAEVPGWLGRRISKFPEPTCAVTVALWVYCLLIFASALPTFPNSCRQITAGQEEAQHNEPSQCRAGGL